MTRPYRPANAWEYADFQERFCVVCERDIDEECQIIPNAMCYPVDDPNYPREWVYDARGVPCCTAFREVGA